MRAHYTSTSLRSFGGIAPTLGERVLIDPSAVVLGDVVLGDDVSVWPGSVVRGDMHAIRVGPRTSLQDGSVLHIPHAVVMDGAVVEDEVVIAAGALVPPGKVLARGFLYAGTPARPVRNLSDREMAYFRYSADNYVRLKDAHIRELEGDAPA